MGKTWRIGTSLSSTVLRLVGITASSVGIGALMLAAISVYSTHRTALLESARNDAMQYADSAALALREVDRDAAAAIAARVAALAGASRVEIFDLEGRTSVFAEHDHGRSGFYAVAGRGWHGLVGGYSMTMPLKVFDQPAGTMRVEVDSSVLGEAMLRSLSIQFVATLVLIMVALVLTFRRRRSITEPIEKLLEAMGEVARQQDYTQKLEPEGPCEIGSLIITFNEMLAQLQLRDQHLAEHRRQLQEQVVERTRRLEAAARTAERSSRAKGDFLARMSHEIRTPMNGVVGMAELLGSSGLDERQCSMLRTMRTSADALLEIINDILDFSKIEAEYLQIVSEDFSLREVVEDVCELLAPRAHERGLALVLDYGEGAPEGGNGDPLRLRQVLTNLVGNAIKYTTTGQVLVRLQLDGRDENQFAVVIEVIDTGPGIPAEEQGRIWEAFTQVDTFESRRHGGTGLGLAITRQLVELMGGTVGLRSEPGTGSTFWFRLPLANVRHATPAQPWSLVGVRALVVLSNEDERRVLAQALESAGAWTCDAATGHRALERLAIESAFDLLILDHDLPDMGGTDLLRRLRSSSNLAALPVIMSSTGDAAPATGADSACEPDAWLRKPARIAMVQRAIDRCLGRQSPESTPDVSSTRILRTLSLNVLLVEDSAVNVEVAAGMLEALGCQVTVASNGALGVEHALGQAFDAVLMDCQMPLMDGFEATRKIRSGEAFHGRTPVPIVALTANALPGDRERCLDAGMTDFISKPFTLHRLATVLHAAVGAPTVAPAAEMAAAETSGETSRLAVLEPGQLEELRSLGRPQLVNKTLILFLRQGSELLAELDRALAAGDQVTAERVAHTLRSASLSVGGRRLAALAGACEAALRGQDPETGRSHASRLRPEFAVLSDALSQMLDQDAAGLVA